MIRDEVLWYATVALLAILAFYLLPTYELLTVKEDPSESKMQFVLTDSVNAPLPLQPDIASEDVNNSMHDFVRKSSIVPQTCIGCGDKQGGGGSSITGSSSINSTVPGDQDSSFATSNVTEMEPNPYLTSFAAFGR